MKHVFQIFARDLRKIIRNPFALVVAIGIAILPSLYAWFNIAACWDPYGNTKGISVAVANTDDGYELSGVSVNVGGMIIDNLAKNDQIGWKFVSREQALQGVEDGAYYAAVIIPHDFSNKIASVLSNDVQRPSIEYYVNQKKNAIAPKITDKGVNLIQQQVNETFIATATEVIGNLLITADKDFQNAQRQPLDGLIESLQKADDSLGDFSTAITAFQEASLAIDDVLSTVEGAMPQTQNTLDDAIRSVEDVQGLINSSKAASIQVTSSLENLSGIARDAGSAARQSLNEAFALLDSDAQGAAAKLRDTKENLYHAVDFNNKIIASLQDLNSALPMPLQGVKQLIEKLERSNASLNQLIASIEEISRTLEKTGSIPLDVQNKITSSLDRAQGELSDVLNVYKTSVRPSLETAVDDVYTSMGSLSGLLTSLGTTMPGIEGTLKGTSNALGHTVDALEQTNILIGKTRNKIGGMVAGLSSAKADERWDKLLEIIRNDPSVTASFLSSPVQVNTNNLYAIENYGSAMTPFYTILCLWVGGLVLVAILKCSVKEDDVLKDLKPTEVYFGRYLIFLFVGLLQTLIVCLGDLYMLNIQCENVPLFLLSAFVSSLVFTNIIYTLTISFGDVGKALAVILLVVQVAGAGGTFPIEVMPQFFQNVNPLLPFTHGINAMRETIAGIYQNAYWIDMLKLLCYLPVSLFVGVVLRKPLIKLNHFFEQQLEETGIM
ncbi:MAG: YhgE/Pip domain-containing protein [Clostridiales bacterium]|nr:YhgE/Pip domain-containing protein [Clostridiales bacterium]